MMTRMADCLNALGQPIGVPVEDWSPRQPPRHEAMKGAHGILEPLVPEQHEAALFDAFSEDGSGRDWTYLSYGPFDDRAAFGAHLRSLAAATDTLFFTVIDGSRRPVGLASYLRIDPSVGSVEVGHIHFAPTLQRTPLATEVMFMMMRHVFDDLGYRRYEWKCDALNAGSCAAAKRLGFRYEGTFRNARVYKQRNRDTAWFSIVDTEWSSMSAAFEAWLSVDNFDVHGGQRRSLSACRGKAAAPLSSPSA